jgi:hypothetical protein
MCYGRPKVMLMAISSTTTRALIVDDGPLAPAQAMKLHAAILLADVEMIQQNQHSSGPYILLAHAFELLLKAYTKGAEALKPARRKENTSHDLERALKEAQDAGLVCSHRDTEEVVKRFSDAVQDARLRYKFPFHELPTPMVCLEVGRALLTDIGTLVRPDTLEKMKERRAAEKAEADARAKRQPKLP